MQGNILTGSEGSVTCRVDGLDKEITFAFKCSGVENNDL